jgi:cytochrome c oxidase subunit 3
MSVVSDNVADSISGLPPAANTRDSPIDSDDLPARLRRYRLGLALYIMSVAMLFVGFSSAYVVRRGVPMYEPATGAYSQSWELVKLPVPLLLLNTLWLCLASGTIEFARRRSSPLASDRSASQRSGSTRTLLVLSLAFALIFLGGQVAAWQKLKTSGYLLKSGAREAFFYVFTGAHAFHIVLGISVLAVIAICYRSWSRKTRLMAIDLTAWYLHAMALVWLYTFAFLMFG